MWFSHVFLGFTGLISGIAVAGGAFALITSLTIIPRLAGWSSTAKRILKYEDMIMAGGVAGNIVSVYPQLSIPLGRPLLIVYGLFSGVQVGCLVMALAEIMNVFPVIFRRLRMKSGLAAVIFAMAAGKIAGGLWYFYQGMGS